MEYKGAIFDMDGLMFDTEDIYQETWNELAAENGVTLGKDFVADICGTSGAHMCKVIEKHYGVADGSMIMEECMKLPDVLAPSEEIRKIADKIYDSLDGFTEEILETNI